MKPGRNNYEAWLIDYIDGSLDRDQERDLFLFLDANPDIREEFKDMLNYRLPVPDQFFTGKESLKKSAGELPDHQFEMLCVAYMENDLTISQKRELEAIIANDHSRKKSSEEIKRIRLVPPPLKYKYKSRLKRVTLQGRIIRIAAAATTAAAAVIIAVTILREPATQKDFRQPSAAINNTVSKTEKETQVPVYVAVYHKNAEQVNNAAVIHPEKTGSESVPAPENIPDSTTFLRTTEKIEISKIGYLSSLEVIKYDHEPGLVPVAFAPSDDYAGNPEFDLNERLTRLFRERIYKSDIPETGAIKAYEIADACINGINKLFGLELSLDKNTDENGQVSSVTFNSRLLTFNSPVKKSEPEE